MSDGQNGGAPQRPEDGGVYLDQSAYELVKQYETARRAAKLWADAQRKAKAAIVSTMGSAEFGHFAGKRVVSVVRVRPQRFNQARFAEDHAGLWDQYRETPDEDEVRLIIGKELPGMPVEADS